MDHLIHSEIPLGSEQAFQLSLYKELHVCMDVPAQGSPKSCPSELLACSAQLHCVGSSYSGYQKYQRCWSISIWTPAS